MHSDKMEDIDASRSGDIVALFGIDCSSGTTFTDARSCQHDIDVRSQPVIELVIEAQNRDQLNNLSKGLNRFTKEDPTFRVEATKNRVRQFEGD